MSSTVRVDRALRLIGARSPSGERRTSAVLRRWSVGVRNLRVCNIVYK